MEISSNIYLNNRNITFKGNFDRITMLEREISCQNILKGEGEEAEIEQSTEPDDKIVITESDILEDEDKQLSEMHAERLRAEFISRLAMLKETSRDEGTQAPKPNIIRPLSTFHKQGRIIDVRI